MIGSFHGAYDYLAGHVLPQECDHFLGSSWKIRAHLCGVEYPAPVVASESTCLNPCVRVVI
ncbi:MAG: hypothetical protein ABSD75_33985 [Terriglobales bacterium]